MTYGEALRAMGTRLVLTPEPDFKVTAALWAAPSEPWISHPRVIVTLPNLASLCVPSDPPVPDGGPGALDKGSAAQ